MVSSCVKRHFLIGERQAVTQTQALEYTLSNPQ